MAAPRRKSASPAPTLASSASALDSILDTTFTPEGYPSGEAEPLSATVEYNLAPDSPVTLISPDEPPPEFDPQFQHIDKKLSRQEVRKRHDEHVKNKQENARYHNALVESMAKEMDSLQAALSTSDNPNARGFLLDLTSFKYKGWSATRIASKHGISPNQLSMIWRDYHLSKAMLVLTGSLDKTAARMVQDATGGEVVCPHCDGRTTVKMEIQYTEFELAKMAEEGEAPKEYKVVVCPNCKGEGTILKPGHEHSRDRIFEAVGLTKKGGLNITNVINMPNVESVIDELERSKAIPAQYSEVPSLPPAPEKT